RTGLASLTLLIAAPMWLVVFSDPPWGFWLTLTLATSALLFISVVFLRNEKPTLNLTPSGLLLGLLSGLLLYSFLAAGFHVTRQLVPRISSDAAVVYSLGSQTDIALIGALLLFPIAPAEEFYWRGLLQREWQSHLGPVEGLLLTSAAYGLIHLVTLNASLILVASMGGVLWGWLFQRTGSLVPGIISHALFNELVFVVLPLS
ncbi:MAG: lysostaphin resistance A-like protein, partial [Candidatus Geothermarchaeales archaeon]